MCKDIRFWGFSQHRCCLFACLSSTWLLLGPLLLLHDHNHQVNYVAATGGLHSAKISCIYRDPNSVHTKVLSMLTTVVLRPRLSANRLWLLGMHCNCGLKHNIKIPNRSNWHQEREKQRQRERERQWRGREGERERERLWTNLGMQFLFFSFFSKIQKII